MTGRICKKLFDGVRRQGYKTSKVLETFEVSTLINIPKKTVAYAAAMCYFCILLLKISRSAMA